MPPLGKRESGGITMDTNEMVKQPYMQNRELSWLDFNKRVLDQGADPTVPLLERLNFISIFWSNLQEFFMVRVGSLTDLALIKKTIIDSKSGMTPQQQLDAIYEKCHELYPYYQQTFENVRALLGQEGIRNTRKEELTEEQLAHLDRFMHTSVLPFLSPQIINMRHPFPHLENGALYIVVRLNEPGSKHKEKGKEGASEPAAIRDEKAKAPHGKDGKDKGAKNVGAKDATLGIIPLPRQVGRIISLPGDGAPFMLIEHAIEMYAREIFSMYQVKHTNIICVTRNADLDAVEGAEEQGDDYREHMKRILKKRSRLAPVRLESERPLSNTVRAMLTEKLGLAPHQLFVTSVPLDLSYTWGLAGRVKDTRKRAQLTVAPFTPHWPACFSRKRPILDQVREKEVLLSYPYQSMDAFVQMLREAAADPDVVSIKITLYRLARQSHLAEALINAAENGKEVTALFELRARFDEFNNIEWSQRFEEAGCHVIYGFKNYKVHSKICAITRRTESGIEYVTQIGTGNYNEKTSKLYTDFSFITSDERIGRDAAKFFQNMLLENSSDAYDLMWVAPLQIKRNIMRKIDEQIALAKEGKPCGLFFKTNSITDKELIEKIVEASQAGVHTTLFVRGICCLVPGVEGYTDNVRVVSIVGQLLEHSRIYCFGPRETAEVYLSSADLMTRNMDKRVEIAWPVLNENLRRQVLGYLEICLADTAKLRELEANGAYTPLGFFAKENANGSSHLFDSQKFLIAEAQRGVLCKTEVKASKLADTADFQFDQAHGNLPASREEREEATGSEQPSELEELAAPAASEEESEWEERQDRAREELEAAAVRGGAAGEIAADAAAKTVAARAVAADPSVPKSQLPPVEAPRPEAAPAIQPQSAAAEAADAPQPAAPASQPELVEATTIEPAASDNLPVLAQRPQPEKPGFLARLKFLFTGRLS